MSKLCLTCSDKNPFKAKSIRKAKWLTKAKRENALPVHRPCVTSSKFHPQHATIKIRIKVAGKSKETRKILWWGAKPKRIQDSLHGALKSYDCYQNMGIAYINKNGFVTIRAMAPTPYREEGKIWPPHLHFVYANKNEWSTSVYTIAAYPGHHGKKIGNRYEYEATCLDHTTDKCSILTPQQVKQNWKKLIVVNALPVEYAFEYKINDQVHLPYTSDTKTIKKACQKIKEKAYVVYCAKRTCIASSKLILKMIEAGCHNVYYMPGGAKEWNETYKK